MIIKSTWFSCILFFWNSIQVIDEHVIQSKPEIRNNKTHILRAQWFWYTIQNGYANELDYQFGDVSILRLGEMADV